jgi:hypothetical protein
MDTQMPDPPTIIHGGFWVRWIAGEVKWGLRRRYPWSRGCYGFQHCGPGLSGESRGKVNPDEPRDDLSGGPRRGLGRHGIVRRRVARIESTPRDPQRSESRLTRPSGTLGEIGAARPPWSELTRVGGP